MHSVGFEPTISAGERPKTYALYRAATGTGKFRKYERKILLAATHKFEAHENQKKNSVTT